MSCGAGVHWVLLRASSSFSESSLAHPKASPSQDPQLLPAVHHQLLQQFLPLLEQSWILRIPDGLQGVQVGFLSIERKGES